MVKKKIKEFLCLFWGVSYAEDAADEERKERLRALNERRAAEYQASQPSEASGSEPDSRSSSSSSSDSRA